MRSVINEYAFIVPVHIGNAVRPCGEAAELDILVSPRSAASRIDGFDQWRQRVTVKVRAPPSEGKANQEIVSLFREITGTDVSIIKGAGSRMKTLYIAMPAEELRKKMEVL
ncbi:MAG: uncharacterized protein PWQ88_1250 [Candidatus Methanomethylophilaceae archaeon]|nr:uncharacterized protein [Candidatus Methanomethylophilaceae archaeon]MDI3541185.1 uncharacterized protein [Candidatus Methanomethylophilaceae archaeon]HIJ00936.1 YggU family protein [Candidatus Methanomethylophilaceae archaeon]